MRVVVALLEGLVEPMATRLLAASPLAASNEPGELGSGITPEILAAAGSIRLAGILLPGNAALVVGSKTAIFEAEKSPLRNAALGTVDVLK